MYRLFGTESQTTSADWIVTHINFTSIFPRTCGASDYHQWVVSDQVSYYHCNQESLLWTLAVTVQATYVRTYVCILVS